MAQLSDLTYGRNTSIGSLDVRQKYQDLVTAATKFAKGDKYNAVISTIDKYWAGEDAEKFKTLFRSQVDKMAYDLVHANIEVMSVIDDDKATFIKGQASISSTLMN